MHILTKAKLNNQNSLFKIEELNKMMKSMKVVKLIPSILTLSLVLNNLQEIITLSQLNQAKLKINH